MTFVLLCLRSYHYHTHASDDQEYVATCVNEAVAMADKLMTLSIIESTSETDDERFQPSHTNFYVLRVSHRRILRYVSFSLSDSPKQEFSHVR